MALAAAGTVLLAGCGGQVGAAAVVGSASISTADIDAQRSALPGGAAVDDVLAADRASQVSRIAQDRTLVTYAVWHEQLRQAGVVSPLTEEQLASILADPANVQQVSQLLLATPDTLEDRIADTLSLQQLVVDAIQAVTPVSGPTVEYEYLPQATLTDALTARTRYAGQPDLWAADLAAAGTDGGGSGTAVAAGPEVTLIPTGLFSAAEGSFVVAPSTDGSATVLRITARSVTSAPLDGAAVQQLAQQAPAAISALGAMVLAQGAGAAAADGTEINPRFGVWDPAVVQVVPAPAQL